MAFSEPHCPQNEFFIFVSCNFLVIELNQIGAGMSRKTLRSLQILSQCTNFVIFIAIQKFISPLYFHNSHNILAPNCVLARFGLCRCIRENEFLSCISVIFFLVVLIKNARPCGRAYVIMARELLIVYCFIKFINVVINVSKPKNSLPFLRRHLFVTNNK